jgi:putative ABC transport system permease protein
VARRPAFTFAAVLTLALGIGASTAIFSVVNAVLLRPLPYPDPDRLVFITSDMRNRGVRDFNMAPGDLKDLRDQTTQFTGIAGVITFPAPISGDHLAPEQATLAFATQNLISVLGSRIALGRDFNDADAAPPPPPETPRPANVARPPVDVAVLLSNGFWRSRYGGDPSVIGRTFDLGGNHAHIVGVLAPDFELLFAPRLNVARVPDVIQAARIDWATASRINVIFFCVGRLKPGASLGAARSEVDAVAVDLRRRFPIDSTAGVYFRTEPLRANLVADVRPALLALLGGVVFVLLIACANVANLVLVRTSRRERELAVRAAFGGSRARLVRQMLVESLVLAFGGVILGLAVAKLGVALLTAIGPQNLPNIGAVSLDPVVLAFSALAALSAAALFGIVPAIRASRPDVIGVLRSAGRTSGLGAGRFLSNAVVVAEVTLAFVLLIGGGLMFRSFLAITGADPGFDPHGVLTFVVQNANALTEDSRAAFQSALHDRLGRIPGATGVTAGAPLPLDGTAQTARWGTIAAVTDPSSFHQANVHAVIPGYFGVMRTPILAGRDFTDADNRPKSQAVIIDDLLAAKAFPGENAVGKRLLIRARTDTAEWVDVIGVVRHEWHDGLTAPGREAFFMTDGQFGFGVAARWAVRTSGDPARLAPQARAAVAELDPTVPVANVRPMDEFVAQAGASTRFALVLIGAFAGIAVVLSGVGLYGVISTSVRQRTAEIGVRMALGAPAMGIFQLVIGQGMRLSLAGIGAGLIASFILTRVMRSMLVGVAPTDPATFVAVVVLFFSIAALACYLPARRAAGLDPSHALRDE